MVVGDDGGEFDEAEAGAAEAIDGLDVDGAKCVWIFVEGVIGVRMLLVEIGLEGFDPVLGLVSLWDSVEMEPDLECGELE